MAYSNMYRVVDHILQLLDPEGVTLIAADSRGLIFQCPAGFADQPRNDERYE